MPVKDRELQWRGFADFAILEKLLDDFAMLTGITTVIIDTSGEHITKQTLPYNELCMRLIKGTSLGKQRCDECDLEWGAKAANEQTYKVYTCRNGLIDFVAPIMFEDEVLGYLFGGQVFVAEEPPDREWHTRNAKELGLDPSEYLEALDKITVLPRDRIEAAARMLYNIANSISILTIQWINEREEAREKRKVLVGLQEMVANMIAELDLQVVLQKAVDRMADLVGADIVTIHIYDPLTGKVRAAAGYGLLDRETFGRHRPGRGKVALQVASRGEPVIAEDVPASELAGPFAARERVQSAAGFPLKAGDKVIGVLFVSYREPHKFEPEEVEALVSFGNFVAVAIQNAQLLQQERTLRQQAETLREVSTAISSALDLKEVAGRILDELGKVVEYRRASIQLIQGDARTLIAGRGFDVETADEWLLRPLSQDRLISRIVASEQPLILPEPSKDPDWEIRPETANVKSWVGLPLIYGGEAIGLLTLDHDQPGFYTQAVEGLLVSFANQAAIAIKNARLFDDAERRIRDLEIVNDIVQIMSTRLDTEDLLRTVVSQIADKLNCTHCTLFFPKEEKGEVLLVPRVTQGLLSDQIMRRRFKPDEGLAGWVFQHGTSLVLADAKEDPRFSPATVERDRPRSMLVAPVRVGDRTIGVISADQDEYGWFSESDRRLVDALARHAGIAIERAMGLELLQDIGNRIISVQKVDEILQQVVYGAIRLTNTTSGIIYLISEDEKSVVKSFLYPPDFDHPEPRIGGEEGLTRRVIATGEMLILPDIRQDARVNPALYNRIRSMVAIPLKFEQRVIGVLYLNDANQHDFTETEVSLLSTLANQAAIAIQNARLFEEVRARADEVSLLQRVSARISTTLKLDEILPLLVEGAMHLTKTESGVVHVIDSSGEEIIDSYGYPKEFSHPAPRIREQGYTRLILRRKEQQVVRDAQTDELANPEIKRKGVRSFVGTPLKLGGERVVGVLYVNDTSVRQFTEEELSLLRTLADQAAIAIHNSRLYQEAETRAEALKKLHEVGPILVPIAGAPENLQAILTQIAQNAQSVLGADLVDLYQYVQSRDEYVLPPIQVGERYKPSVRKDKIYEDDVVWTTVKSKQPQYIPEAQQEPSLIGPFAVERPDVPPARFVIREDVKSTAAVPLIVGTEVVGVLFANYRSLQTFPQQQRELIELFASQAAMAIRNARLFEQRRILQDIGRDITRILDKDELLQKILERSLELLGCEIGSIALLNKATNQLEFQYAIGKEEYVSVPFGKGLIGTAAETRKPVRVGDVTKDSRYIEHVAATRSELDVPMLIGEELIGVLNAESTRYNAFDEDSEELAVILAGQAAVALYNAEILGQRAALTEIARDITSELDRDALLQKILERSLKLLDCKVGSIALWNKATGQLKIQYDTGGKVGASLPVDEGLMAVAAQTRQPVRVGDVTKEIWYRKDVPETCSELDVPLLFGNELLGVLNVESPRYNAFSEEDEKVATALASQAAVALYNAVLFEQRNALVEFGQAVTSGFRLREDEILELIHARASELMDTDNMYIALYDEAIDTVRFGLAFVDGQLIDVTTAEGWQPRKAGKGRTEEIIRTREPIFTATKAEAEAWYAQPEHREYLGGLTFASWLGVPMMVGERVLGVIAAYHPTQDHVYSGDDLKILQAMADQAAIALDNSYMFYDVNRRLEALVEFGQAVTSGFRLREDEILELIHARASELMDTDNMYIALYDELTDTVHFGLAFVDGKRIDLGKAEGWQPRKAGKGRTEEIIRTREPIFTATKAEAEAWYAQPEHKEYTGMPIFASWLGVPMMVGERVLGVIAAYHPTQDHVYSGDDLKILQAMADQAAIALDNRRLQDEVVATKQIATLGTAIAALQHRINNTFNIIAPNVTRLRNRVDMTDQTIVEILDIIERNARYTSDIIERIQEPLQEVEPQDVDINAVLNDEVSRVKEMWEADSTRPMVKLNLDLDDSIPQIRAPIGQIAEVFRNLVENAYRAMKEGGLLTVTSRLVDNTICVRVQDTGPGIPPQIQQRLFVKPVPSKELGGGAGLGLWLSQLMLQSIGGYVKIEKSDSTGTTMLIQIPAPGARGKGVRL